MERLLQRSETHSVGIEVGVKPMPKCQFHPLPHHLPQQMLALHCVLVIRPGMKKAPKSLITKELDWF